MRDADDQDWGFEAELTPVEAERVNAIGRWKGTGGGKSLLFNGHLDTNPATEGWTVDPWGGLVDDKFIYGIGVSNMKAGDAAYFCAVKTLIDAGVKLKGDVVLTFVVGELQGGVGTLAAIRQGVRADYFINSEPTDLQALTMHAAAFTFIIELTGITRHLSKREQAVDALVAACDLVPRLNAMTFSAAHRPRSIARSTASMSAWCTARSGATCTNGARPRLRTSSASRAPPATRRGRPRPAVLADLRKVLDELEAPFPGPARRVRRRNDPVAGRSMPPFEVSRDCPIVRAVNAAYQTVRGEPQPTGAITPPGFYGTDAGHLLPTSSAWRAWYAVPAAATTRCPTSASISPITSTPSGSTSWPSWRSARRREVGRGADELGAMCGDRCGSMIMAPAPRAVTGVASSRGRRAAARIWSIICGVSGAAAAGAGNGRLGPCRVAGEAVSVLCAGHFVRLRT